MRQKKTWRYYCDYCNKSGGSKGHMVRHEATCTLNPDRVCGVCAQSGVPSDVIAAVLLALNAPPIASGKRTGTLDVMHLTTDVQHDVTVLRSLVNGCPACMLAAVRQAGAVSQLKWSYSDEKQRYWAARPSRRKRHSLDDDR